MGVLPSILNGTSDSTANSMEAVAWGSSSKV